MGLKLLCIVAHPDDECFAFGGALALAADQGIETSVICLTDGQAATNRGDSNSAEDLGRMRRQEFTDSCNVLGVTHHEFLDYQDAQLEHADFSRAARRLVEKIRAFRPQVVLTFGLDGALNTHPDHTMVAALDLRRLPLGVPRKALPRSRSHPRRRPPLHPLHQLLHGGPPRPRTQSLDGRARRPLRPRA